MVNVRDGNDNVVRRLTGYNPQIWCLGDDMVVGPSFEFGPRSLQCHYNLLKDDSNCGEEHMVKFGLAEHQLSDHVRFHAHGGYVWVASCVLLRLERTERRLSIVHR